MTVCNGERLNDFGSSCVRNFWATILPAVLVALLCLSSIPLPARLQRYAKDVSAPFKTYLTLDEAEALDGEPEADKDATETRQASSPLWRTILVSFLPFALSLAWVAVGCYRLVTKETSGVLSFVVAASWIVPALVSALNPKPTPQYGLCVLYVAFFVSTVYVLGGYIYDAHVEGVPLPVSSLVIESVNLAAVLVLLGIQLKSPLALPSGRVKAAEIGVSASPEDYTTLFGWMSFRWVAPLIARGTNTTLNEGDVWRLSATMRARPVFTKFSTVRRSTLLRRLWAANSRDLLLDFVLTLVSVVFNYAGPFFLKRILESIDEDEGNAGASRNRANAYILAALAFVCTLCKAEADVQHLWFGRRAAVRVRSELMASIYDKALKRKDFSGIVDKDKGKEDKKDKKKDTSDDPKAGADIGKIVNLMAGDANRCANLISGAYFIYGAPFEIIIAGTFLYQILGWSAFAGFIVLVAGWPLNSFIARRRIRIQKGVLTAQDKRMGVLNELIGSIKLIKFMAWQDRWIKRTLDAREVEMQWMIKARINSIFFSLLWTLAPILVSVVSFATYIYTGHELTVPIAFTSIALFSMIRQPLNVIPAWIVQVLQTLVAMKRISTYLDEDEVSEQVSSLKKQASTSTFDPEEKGLGVERGSFKWNEIEEKVEAKATSGRDTDSVGDSASTRGADHRFELKDISVRFPDGVMTVVTGPTASGKTALLLALLGEMTMLEGKLIMSKDASRVDENGFMHIISYAAQSPWLRHQSIRDNILFGYPYDEERYKQVIECCALEADLDILEDGDATEIGARGVSLSGGQKARVALARAVYARTKYVLLDDPLSAVDSHTARVIFEKLLCGPLMANRTVILVTHHVELVLPGAHYLVRMLDGRVDTQGTLSDLRARGLLDEITHDAAVEEKQEEAAEEEAIEEAPADIEAEPGVPKDPKAKKPRKLIKDEARETGSVKWRIYKTYLKASSYWTWVILSALILANQGMSVIEKIWIMTWGQAYGPAAPQGLSFTSFATPEHEVIMEGSLATQHLSGSFSGIQHNASFTAAFTLPDVHQHPFFYVAVYGSIGLATATISILSSVTNFTGALRASRKLFEKLLVSVVCATMRWHDVTPAGRMLNRFSKDIDTVDSSLSGSLQAVNSSLANFLASVITVTFVFPFFLIPATLIGLVYRALAIGYLNTGRDLRRMESNSRSPIFSGFGELLEGIVTVRAFSAEGRFLNDLFGKVDLTTQMWYSFWMTNRWLLLNFDALGALAVLITTLFALSGLVHAGLAGLCITSAMAFTNSVYWACRFWTALELDLNSVERVVEYLDLPQEPPSVIESNRPPAYWPSSTTQNALIQVEDLTVRYAPELPPVLHGVSFALKPRERIGLLGRTGSGKSTLAMSILRFIDPASGKILIDGIDISTIGLLDLRSRVTFIPQDASLFSGTLRDNMDPFEEHSDMECLDVLYRVQMISESAYQSQKTSREPSRAPSIIHDREETANSGSSSPTSVTDVDTKTKISLDTQVSPGGSNFSQGQRQLIALARALLRRSSIIILDEATSSIDFKTDSLIQQTIREEFGDSLLLTVAHRLRTVIDYDRLIVLDKGTIAEFDTPYTLLQKQDGIFRNMCMKSGTFTELEAAAKAKAGF